MHRAREIWQPLRDPLSRAMHNKRARRMTLEPACAQDSVQDSEDSIHASIIRYSRQKTMKSAS